MPCVVQMLYKLSSERTRGPWIRRLFRYHEWLRGKEYFESVAELLEDCKDAGANGKYRHLDVMQEYLNSFRGSLYYKDSIATIIRGFYRKNRAELPREKVTYDRGMLIRGAELHGGVHQASRGLAHRLGWADPGQG